MHIKENDTFHRKAQKDSRARQSRGILIPAGRPYRNSAGRLLVVRDPAPPGGCGIMSPAVGRPQLRSMATGPAEGDGPVRLAAGTFSHPSWTGHHIAAECDMR